MNSRDELSFRLELAEGYLKEAEENFASQKWHNSLAASQASMENAGKAIISCRAPVARTHDVARQLAEVLKDARLPDDLREPLTTMLPDFAQMGMDTHIRVTYGDEELLAPPWEVIQQPEAELGLKRARNAVALGQRFKAQFPPSGGTT